MKNILAKLLIGAVMVSVGAFGADASLGTWKLNMEKSKFSPAPILKSLTSTREASDGGVKVTSTGEQADGTPINASYTAKYNGSNTPVTGAPWDTLAIKRVNAHTFTATAKKTNGKYRSTSRTIISKDGKTMTTTVTGTNAEGKAFNNTMVYDKQ
ncbi:MAG TPA: hypothetical protein VMZ27_02660 [Candidatus Saccharimonadales bacterium]|nr:hypothetical protein [Candidatus Saccharimonadales bacterium]